MNKLLLLLLTLLYVSNVWGYNILVVFPYPGKSHAILGEGYVRHLLNAGHEVTYITSILAKPHPKLKQVDLSTNVAEFEKDAALFNFETFLKEGNVLDPTTLYGFMLAVNNKSITHENVQKFLKESNEKYDLIIAEWLYSELYAGFPVIFNAPFVWALSLEPHPAILSLIDEPQNPAYFPDHMSGNVPPLTFTERVYELWSLIKLYFIRRSFQEADEIAFRNAFGPAAAKRGINLPTLDEIKYKSAMVFGNSHYSSGEAHKLPQNFVAIGGYHIEDKAKPLPEDWQKIMDQAKNGVIYFSMGTMMKSKTLPQKLKKELLQVFSELKETVIWKFEEKLEGLPKNVHIVHWAPQQGILSHPNCKLFITHGGLLSTTETLHYGVPIIGVPLFVDQHVNVIRAVKKGIGLKVDLGYDLPARLKVAIQEILSTPKYREKVKLLSFVYHHRQNTPGASIVHWSEHVIQTKGAQHLQSPAFNVPLYQKFYLDLVVLITIGIAILVIIFKKIMSILCGSSTNCEKANKKKYN